MVLVSWYCCCSDRGGGESGGIVDCGGYMYTLVWWNIGLVKVWRIRGLLKISDFTVEECVGGVLVGHVC